MTYYSNPKILHLAEKFKTDKKNGITNRSNSTSMRNQDSHSKVQSVRQHHAFRMFRQYMKAQTQNMSVQIPPPSQYFKPSQIKRLTSTWIRGFAICKTALLQLPNDMTWHLESSSNRFPATPVTSVVDISGFPKFPTWKLSTSQHCPNPTI